LPHKETAENLHTKQKAPLFVNASKISGVTAFSLAVAGLFTQVERAVKSGVSQLLIHFLQLILLVADMGLIGDFAKAILILAVASWIFLIVEFAVMDQLAVALLLFLAFLIPLGIIIYGYWKDNKRLG
jgi:hypothetical protein